ncbi:MAG: hypothetical protein A2Y17_04775 [Clostridiales bacterium GWF2_38_85]|nr:MAG: hypothetical protein A2Y17_04775 [Clostridiales bacterium GWF2_38_85]HBL84398.1 hypothetical protein [Clostridiales bacterium]
MKKMIFLAVTMIFVLIFGSCEKSKVDNSLVISGKYISGEGINSSYVLLNDDGSFQFSRSMALSYLPTGTYEIKSNKLILSVDNKEKYVFEIQNSKLLYCTDESGSIVKDGTVYTLGSDFGQIKAVQTAIYYSFSSYALFTDDTSIISELEGFYNSLKVEKTDKELDISTAYHVCIGEKSFWIDKDGVIWLDGETENLIKTVGKMDYNRIEQIYNYEECSSAFPFTEPEFDLERHEYDYYEYSNVTSDELAEYIDTLKNEGFECQKGEYTYFLYKDNVIIRITDNTSDYKYFTLSFYIGIETAREGSLTAEQANDIIGIDDNHLIEYYILDLYEKTDAQLFYVLSRDTETNLWPQKYLVTSKEAIDLTRSFDKFICGNIDDDPEYELISLDYGPTSGLFTFGVSAYDVDNGEINLEYSRIFFPESFYNMKLIPLDNDKAGILVQINNSPTKTDIINITIEDGKLILTCGDGTEVSSWGE